MKPVKSDENGLCVKIHVTGEIAPGDDPAQIKVIAGNAEWLIVGFEFLGSTECRVGIGDKRLGKSAAFDGPADLFGGIRWPTSKAPGEFAGQPMHIAANGKVSFDVAEHNS